MKRFLLFAGESFYPNGGFNDFYDAFDYVAEADRTGRILLEDDAHVKLDMPDHFVHGIKCEWYHIVDLETASIVVGYGYSGPNGCGVGGPSWFGLSAAMLTQGEGPVK